MSDEPLYYKTEDGRILCSRCLQVIHHGQRGDAELFVCLKSLPLNEYFVVEKKDLDWKFLKNRVQSMCQYIKRTTGKRFQTTNIEDLGKITIRRIE